MWRVPCHSWEEGEVEHIQHPGWASGKTYTLSHETVFFLYFCPHYLAKNQLKESRVVWLKRWIGSGGRVSWHFRFSGLTGYQGIGLIVYNLGRRGLASSHVGILSTFGTTLKNTAGSGAHGILAWHILG